MIVSVPITPNKDSASRTALMRSARNMCALNHVGMDKRGTFDAVRQRTTDEQRIKMPGPPTGRPGHRYGSCEPRGRDLRSARKRPKRP
jgi:hypothetical protein